MTIDTGDLTDRLLAAGKGLTGDIWGQMQTFAVPELKKIAVQIGALADPTSDWSPDEKTVLLQMQVRASVGVIVALTQLVLLAVQNAVNAILAAVRDFVNAALGFALI